MKLPESFYQRPNVVKIARELLGKALFTRVGGVNASGQAVLTSGMIVETEAYSWKERGSHAYGPQGARKTTRNAVMFGPGAYSYVYLCYGMHNMFNIVTNVDGVADAILIRAVEPLEGVDEMERRRGKLANRYHLTSGPGKLCKALGIDRTLNGLYLLDDVVWVEDIGKKIKSERIVASPRIGIDYAGEDALLPWRFTIENNPWVSVKPKFNV